MAPAAILNRKSAARNGAICPPPSPAWGASARYHAQDGRHPGEVIFCGLLAGVACVPGFSKDGVIEVK